jgi:hypothetical protein
VLHKRKSKKGQKEERRKKKEELGENDCIQSYFSD